jgi:hypothetical protein
MASPTSGYLDSILQDQAARAPLQVDESQWLNRYVFNPFHDREFTMQQQQDFGLPELRQGEILPLTRFRQSIVYNEAVMKVPVDHDGKFRAVGPGIEQFTQKERAPGVVMTALLRCFNVNASDPAQDNGICEITALRGNEDFKLLREIKSLLLPQRYETARQQMLALASRVHPKCPTRIDTVAECMELGREIEALDMNVVMRGITSPGAHTAMRAAKELFRSTLASFTWARWQYHRLIAQMEKPNSGKDQLSPLDAAVCAWIEQDEPRFQSKLAGNQQQPIIIQQTAAPATEPVPTVWCEDCGATTNLGPEGQKPKRCPVCQTPFEAAVENPPNDVPEN